MFTAVVNVANDAAGVEKTLRLAQSVAQVVAGLSYLPEEAAPWLKARSQFALARRYLRLTKWIDCWQVMHTQFYAQSHSSIRTTLAVAKWSFLGIYFFLEMLTIAHAMQLTNTAWGPQIQKEALKFWFYGIVASILISIYDLSLAQWRSVQTISTNEEKQAIDKAVASKDEKKSPSSPSSTDHIMKIYKQLVIDGCDLLIPGSAVGWIGADTVLVGIASCISTVVAGRDIWTRVQG